MSFKPTIVVEDRQHLQQLVGVHMDTQGAAASLNHLDVSRVTDMSYIFAHSQFNGDISQWNTSAVQSMTGMFMGSAFNRNISTWDTSRVTDMSHMFEAASFRGDLGHWNVGNVRCMTRMFDGALFNGDLSAWNVGNCTHFDGMFENSPFNMPIERWDMRKAQSVQGMFSRSKFKKDVSAWDLPLSCDTLRLFAAIPATLAMQKMAPWHAKMHLDNWSLPPEGPMREAMEKLRCIHDALGADNVQRARDIVRMMEPKMQGDGAKPGEGESWALEGLLPEH